MILRQAIKSGEVNEVNRAGRFIKILECVGDLRLEIFKGGEKVIDTIARANFEFEGLVFDKVVITTDTSQKYEMWVSHAKLTYNPIKSIVVGAAGIESKTASVFYGEVAEIFPAKDFRAAVTIQAGDNFYVGGEGITESSAIEIKAGELFSVNTQGALYGYAKNVNYKKKLETQLSASSSVVSQTSDGVAGQNTSRCAAVGGNFYVSNGTNLKVYAGGDLSKPPLTLEDSYVSGLYGWKNEFLVYLAQISYKVYLVVLDTKTNTKTVQKEVPTASRRANGLSVYDSHCAVAVDSKIYKYDLNDLSSVKSEFAIDPSINVSYGAAVCLMANGNALVFDDDRSKVSVIESDGTQTVKTLPMQRAINENGAFWVSESGEFCCAVFSGSPFVIVSNDNGVSFDLIDTGLNEKIYSVLGLGTQWVYGLGNSTAHYTGAGGVRLVLGVDPASIYGLASESGFLYATRIGEVFKVAGDVVATGGLNVKTFSEVN